MSQPKLTIGFAHHTDWDGAYFTLQALRLCHFEAMQDVELVVVDNSPGTPESQLLSEFVHKTLMGRKYAPESGSWPETPGPRPPAAIRRRNLAGVKFVEMGDTVGTSASRERIFAEASAPAVLVLDCHVLVEPGGIARLIEWFADPDRRDIYSGPMRHDDLMSTRTHFDPQWRGGMYGTWGIARQCPCGPAGVQFAAISDGGKPERAKYQDLGIRPHSVSSCDACGGTLPDAFWSGLDASLDAYGYRRLGDEDGLPFEIPGCGLGLFASRVDAWPGFCPGTKGFGGEELYIHAKYWERGDRAVCLPWLKWVHRFGRANVPYSVRQWDRVRNYVLEWLELGRPLDDIYEHFVARGSFRQAHWDYLLADPLGRTDPPVVSDRQYQARIQVCAMCEHRATPHCRVAQAIGFESELEHLARSSELDCPVGRWEPRQEVWSV